LPQDAFDLMAFLPQSKEAKINATRRQGAGRPTGVAAKRKIAKAAKLIAEGLTPLDSMVRTMRALFEAGQFAEAPAIVMTRILAIQEQATRHHKQTPIALDALAPFPLPATTT
jgi:hypothetical protein